MSDERPDRDLLPELKLLASLAPLRGDQLARYVQDVHDRRDRRRQAMATAALERFDGAEDLLQRINRDERLQWMLETAVDAAGRAMTEQKARALGRALASGALAADDAQIDEAAQMLRIVADLEAPDIRVLDVLVRSTLRRTLDIEGIRGAPDPLESIARYTLSFGGLRDALGLDPSPLDRSLGVLERHFLARTYREPGVFPSYYATNAGGDLLDFLLADGEEPGRSELGLPSSDDGTS